MNLYHIYDDGDGHKYLIPKEEVDEFYNTLATFKEDIKRKEEYVEVLESLLEQYEILEGNSYYVVLDKELDY